RRQHVAATLLALTGLGLLAGEAGSADSDHRALLGCLLVLLPQFAWAMYGVIGKSLIERISWPYLCRDTFALGSLMLLPFALVEGWWLGWGAWNFASVATLLYLAIANSVCTYGLWNSALQDIPVSTASFILYVQPVSGALLSWWLFNEALGMRGACGSALIFVAMALVLFPSHKH
ncbi:MAG TPA: DMT family transporter, partial [Candidatus Ozemobacteraceae bacterium]|nr:DMT family transporter [Candidatus Ozemobacteraceae bacterium]